MSFSRTTSTRSLETLTTRRAKQNQDIFVGLGFQLLPPDTAGGNRQMEATLVYHDGTGVTDRETRYIDYDDTLDQNGNPQGNNAVGHELVEHIRHVQDSQIVNVRLVAIAEPVPEEMRNTKGRMYWSTTWMHLDAIPFIIVPPTHIFTKLPAPSTLAGATSAVSEALTRLHPATHSATVATTDPIDHHVEVDCRGDVRLCTSKQYIDSTSPELWSRFIALAELLNANKIKMAFFSATPQGGGVALMRHALIRLWRLVGVDVKWYVPEGHPSIFDITKRKFHNVLQGVAPDGVEIDDTDKAMFETWIEQNYDTFWAKGALDADVIIIDDPQPAPLIPIIKKHNPKAKLMFRSHIQVQSPLADDPSTPQYRTWNYLYNFIKDTDLFLSHPVDYFVPKNVRENMPLLYMPPATDPLDGLNKPYGRASKLYFRQVFNDLARKQGGVTMDWSRGYICQIARFDPSKGYDVLLEAYRDFRVALKNEGVDRANTPQLVLMGHGSVDDPDGGPIYNGLHEILAQDDYKVVREDVAIVRAPPSDSILGCILQGAWVATQLSTREGFEVKVTEAVHKRVPIIISDAGGIPLQVKVGVNGWVVPAGESGPVADLLLDIYHGKESAHRPLAHALARPHIRSQKGGDDPDALAERWADNFCPPVAPKRDDSGATSEDFWTVGNAARWMLLATRLLGLKPEGKDTELLESMGVGVPIAKVGEEGNGLNVWKLLMGKDMPEGEGKVIF